MKIFKQPTRMKRLGETLPRPELRVHVSREMEVGSMITI